MSNDTKCQITQNVLWQLLLNDTKCQMTQNKNWNKWLMTHDIWQMTNDIWHMTNDTWHMKQNIKLHITYMTNDRQFMTCDA